MLTTQSPISKGEPVKRLLVPHNKTIFFSDGGNTGFLVCQNTFSALSPPIPKCNAFNGIKYLERPAIESPNNNVCKLIF